MDVWRCLRQNIVLFAAVMSPSFWACNSTSSARHHSMDGALAGFGGGSGASAVGSGGSEIDTSHDAGGSIGGTREAGGSGGSLAVDAPVTSGGSQSGGQVDSGGMGGNGGTTSGKDGGTETPGGGSVLEGGVGGSGGKGGSGGSTLYDGGWRGSDAKDGAGGMVGPDAATGGGGTSNSGGSSGGCPGCGPLEQCWNGRLCVAKSLSVPAGFSIDVTEVTRAQYEGWLASQPSTAGQAAICAWNLSYSPAAECMAGSSVCQSTACAQHPQPCVDQCDASAYCRAVGKRLCGAIAGGSVSAISDESQSEWYNACSSNGVNLYTWGNTMAASKCNDYTEHRDTTAAVGSFVSCHSSVAGYEGILDLIGNVAEWEDNCTGTDGQTDACRSRGNYFGQGAARQSCIETGGAKRSTASPTLGFRCCGS
jgi:formylglycine-generating enzyme